MSAGIRYIDGLNDTRSWWNCLRTNKHELWSAIARQGSQKCGSQRQIQHAGFVDEHSIALQRVVSGVLECANNLV